MWPFSKKVSGSSPTCTTDQATVAKSVEVERRSKNESPGQRIILTVEDENAAKLLGHEFTPPKKWTILTVVFLVQISMNLNASVYANSVNGMVEEFGVSRKRAFLGQMVFLVAYVSVVRIVLM
jgi:hypothetical protein